MISIVLYSYMEELQLKKNSLVYVAQFSVSHIVKFLLIFSAQW